MRSVKRIVVALAIVAAGCGGAIDNSGDENSADLSPTGRGIGTISSAAKPDGNAKPQRGNGISYHGGPVMLNTPNIHFIWYGSWGNTPAQDLLRNWAANIGGSGYYNINTTYYDGANQHVSNAANYTAGFDVN